MTVEELEKAFNAGREQIKHPDYDFVYDSFEDYLKTLPEAALSAAKQEQSEREKELDACLRELVRICDQVWGSAAVGLPIRSEARKLTALPYTEEK